MKYTLDQIMEMLGGHTYYTPEQVMFVYYKCNEDDDNAEVYMDLCNIKNEELKQKAINMRFEEDIKKDGGVIVTVNSGDEVIGIEVVGEVNSEIISEVAGKVTSEVVEPEEVTDEVPRKKKK